MISSFPISTARSFAVVIGHSLDGGTCCLRRLAARCQLKQTARTANFANWQLLSVQ